MNTKAQEYDKKEIPLLVRSDRWIVAERTENQVFAICLKNKQNDMIVQMNQQIMQQTQKIEQLNQKIDSQNKLIDQQNRKIEQQNKKIDDLNNLLNLQNNKNAKTQNRIEIQDKNNQNSNTGKTVNIQPVPNETIKYSSSGSRTAILMAVSNPDPNATVFGSKIKRSEISAVYTKDTLKYIPSSAWDVSDSRNGSVMAWTSMASDGKSYILYLAANGKIYANPNCSYLFANYTNLTTVNFSHLKTNLVTNMCGMFDECSNLKQLDFSHWDVSNVTDMSFMFANCEQLTSIDISNWNVSNVTDMNNMFFYCSAIEYMKKGELSSWKLNPAVTMKNMCVGTKFQDKPMDLFHVPKRFFNR